MRLKEDNLLERLRRERPLIHCMTNYVTAGDVANYLLAAGASPVMADSAREAEEVTAAARGLVLNLGTLSDEKLAAMRLAGKKAAVLGHPIVLDPVGAGGASFRTEAAKALVHELPCSVIRGNVSEILALSEESSALYGVDAGKKDELDRKNLERCAKAAERLARMSGAVVVMTGKKDLIADENRYCLVDNGHPMMKRITGAGCMLDGLTAAFLGVSIEEKKREWVFERAVYAAAAHGLCGEMAWEKTEAAKGGAGTFHTCLFDAVSIITDHQIQEGARIEI